MRLHAFRGTESALKLKDVGMLIKIARELSVTHTSTSLFSLVIDGLNWLKKAAERIVPCNNRKFKKSDAEEILEQYPAPKVKDRLLDLWLTRGTNMLRGITLIRARTKRLEPDKIDNCKTVDITCVHNSYSCY